MFTVLIGTPMSGEDWDDLLEECFASVFAAEWAMQTRVNAAVRPRWDWLVLTLVEQGVLDRLEEVNP